MRRTYTTIRDSDGHCVAQLGGDEACQRFDAAPGLERKRNKLCAPKPSRQMCVIAHGAELIEDSGSFSVNSTGPGACVRSRDSEDCRRYRRTNWRLPCQISGAEGVRRSRRNRRHLRLRMHHDSGYHSAQPNLRHTASESGFPQRMGHGGR
jgi:hypothetical protein